IVRANLDGSAAETQFIPAFAYTQIELAGSYIYFAGHPIGGFQAIGRATLDGTGVQPQVIDTRHGPPGGAGDSEQGWWYGGGEIHRALLDGTGIQRHFINTVDDPCAIAVDGQHVYWAYGGGGPAGIGRANLDGTDVRRSFIDLGASGQYVFPCS